MLMGLLYLHEESSLLQQQVYAMDCFAFLPEASFLMFSDATERVHWERMGEQDSSGGKGTIFIPLNHLH